MPFAVEAAWFGLSLFLLGILALLIAWLAAQWNAGRRQHNLETSPPASFNLDLEPSDSAVVITRPGGLLASINAQARAWFQLQDEQLDLDQLARRARPSELFLELCAAEGAARLTIGDRTVDASSHRLPLEHETRMAIIMRPARSSERIHESAGLSDAALRAISEISRSSIEHEEVEQTITVLLARMLRLFPCDIAEITLWDEQANTLIPFRAGSARSAGIERSQIERYRPGEGYTGWLIEHGQALLIPDVDRRSDVQAKVDRSRFPFNAYMGVPLTLGELMLGTLEIASYQPNAFDQESLELLEVVASQVAAVIHNAQLHQDQEQRAAELAGLSELTQAVGSLTDHEELFQHLTQGIAPILQVEVLGFLLYDDTTQSLIGQIPFHGIPEPFVERYYRIPSHAGSALDTLWREREFWLSNDAVNDPEIDALGLRPLTQAASISNTLVVPITSGGRRLGIIQAANKVAGKNFHQDDIRLLSILAGQSAALIENAQLVAESRRRAERAEGLRRVTALASSAAHFDEVLLHALRELARLLRADIATILLLDEAGTELSAHPASLIGIDPQQATDWLRLATDDRRFHDSVTANQRPFLANQAAEAPSLLPTLQALVDHGVASNLLSIPLVIEGAGVGEILLGKKGPTGFSAGDLQLASTIAGQVAGAVERARLSAQTDASLRRRVEQLTALVRISRELNLTLDLEHLITQVHDEALRTTGADCGTTVLFNPDSNPDDPQIALILGDHAGSHTLSPLEHEAMRSGGPKWVHDFLASEHAPEHEGVRSALLIPIAYQGQTAGLIHLHGRRPAQFDETSAQIGEALAIQAAIAYGNAYRYQEQMRRAELLRRNAEALSQIFQISNAVRSDQPLEVNLETIAYGLQAASGFNLVVLGLYRPEGRLLERVAAAGLPLSTLDEIKRNPQEWEQLAGLFREEFRISQSYLVTHDQMPANIPDLNTVLVLRDQEARADAWHPEDILLIPLIGRDGSPVGLISLDDPRNGRHPDRETIETIEIFANQAVLAIENTTRYARVESRVEILTHQLDNMRQSHEKLSRSAHELLIQEGEKADQVQRLARQLSHIQALTRLIESIDIRGTQIEILEAFAERALKALDLGTILIALPHGLRPSIAIALGELPSDANLDVLFGQHNPLATSFHQQKSILIGDVSSSTDWALSPLLRSLNAESALAMPIFSAEELAASVLLMRQESVEAFTVGDLEMLRDFFGLLGETLQKARLFQNYEQRLAEGNLMLEFSRQIGSIELESVMSSLANGLRRVMPATDASLVALWDEDQEALVPYGSAGYVNEEILNAMRFKSGEGLAGKVFQAAEEQRWEQIDFSRDVDLSKENIEAYHGASGGLAPASALGVPLLAGDSLVGAIVLENFATPGAFNDDDATLVRSLARQAALMTQNARLFRSSADRARLLETLANVAATLTSSLDRGRLVQTLLIQFGRVLPYDSATLWFREEQGLRVVAAQGFADDEDRIGLSVKLDDSALYEEMVRSKQPILVPDTTQDPRFPSFPDYPVRSWLGIPLISRDEVIGLLSLDKHETQRYHEEHLEIATTLARQAAVALENAQLYEQARQSSEDLERRVDERTEDLAREHERAEALLRITTELSTSLDLDRVLNRALALVNDVVFADRGTILLVSPESDNLIHRASIGGQGVLPPGGRPSPFKRGEGLAGWVIENRQAVIVPDLTADERWRPWEEKTEEHKSALVVPLMVSEDALGALMLLSHRRNAFNEGELRLVSAAANQVAAAINNAELYRLIRDQAERLGGMLRDQQVEASKSRAILEAIADGVIVTDNNNRVTLFNAAAERILGLQRISILGHSSTEFIGVYGRAGRRWVAAIESWSREPPEIIEDPHFSERLTLDDGRFVSVNLAPVVLGDEFLGTVSIFRDITREVEVDRLKSEFVATVSHELRTPMTSIKGYVEVLLMGAAGPLNDEQQRFLNIVKSNTDRLGILVNDLLDISRIEAGRVNLSIQPLDIRELLEEAREFIERRCRESGKQLEVEISVQDKMPHVRGDPERLRQIVINLADNSFNYTPDGGRIELRAHRQGAEVEIEIADNGIGIAHLDRDRIFERFYRGEQALTLGVAGTGLGLSIVLNLVEMHGGNIRVQSDGVPGQGSVFTFTLPVLEEIPEMTGAQD